MILISRFKVKGHSMEPILKNGSFFIASSIPFLLNNPKIGDIIIFKSENKIIVKKISKIKADKFFIEGENKNDSKKFAPLSRNKILGKVIMKIAN